MMIEKIFEYSISNSQFEPYAKEGSDKNSLKVGYKNRYYKMCSSNKSLRVGYIQYNSGEFCLTFTATKKEYDSTIEFVKKAVSGLTSNLIVNSKDKAGKSMQNTWEVEVSSKSIDELFSLQELLLLFFEQKSN